MVSPAIFENFLIGGNGYEYHYERRYSKPSQKAGGDMCLSLCSHGKSGDTQQNPIRFKNLLSIAEKHLIDQGFRENELKIFFHQ